MVSGDTGLADRCQAIKCEPSQPGSGRLLTEEPYPLPFLEIHGEGMLPTIVFAIATHMMIHPESDLLDVLSCEKTLLDARQDADLTYRTG